MDIWGLLKRKLDAEKTREITRDSAITAFWESGLDNDLTGGTFGRRKSLSGSIKGIIVSLKGQIDLHRSRGNYAFMRVFCCVYSEDGDSKTEVALKKGLPYFDHF